MRGPQRGSCDSVASQGSNGSPECQDRQATRRKSRTTHNVYYGELHTYIGAVNGGHTAASSLVCAADLARGMRCSSARMSVRPQLHFGKS